MTYFSCVSNVRADALRRRDLCDLWGGTLGIRLTNDSRSFEHRQESVKVKTLIQ